jgi:hypothetical protein
MQMQRFFRSLLSSETSRGAPDVVANFMRARARFRSSLADVIVKGTSARFNESTRVRASNSANYGVPLVIVRRDDRRLGASVALKPQHLPGERASTRTAF